MRLMQFLRDWFSVSITDTVKIIHILLGRRWTSPETALSVAGLPRLKARALPYEPRSIEGVMRLCLILDARRSTRVAFLSKVAPL